MVLLQRIVPLLYRRTLLRRTGLWLLLGRRVAPSLIIFIKLSLKLFPEDGLVLVLLKLLDGVLEVGLRKPEGHAEVWVVFKLVCARLSVGIGPSVEIGLNLPALFGRGVEQAT